MKDNQMKKNCLILGAGAAVLASALLWSQPLIASDYSFSGESNTIFRMRKTVDDKNLFPAYEYLRLNLTDSRADGSEVSFYMGAWGRADLGDKSESSRTAGDVQYAYLTYYAPKNNTAVSVGRQFISEGVATERVDGVYLRNDFQYGFGASAFLGNSITTEATLDPKYNDGTIIYGARISQENRKYYSVGLSALKVEQDGPGSFREEEGVDIWIHPITQLDLTGRSSYNSITNGWMESSYALTYSPLNTLRLGADYSHVNFKDYLYNVTTPALGMFNSVWNSNEKQTAVGTSLAYTGISNLTVGADYKFYSYDKSGDASYFGGKISYRLPEELVVGANFHRMSGDVDKLRYLECRAFASKKIGHADLVLDLMNVNYDKRINGINNSYAFTGAAGYELNHKLKLGADFEYSRNPDFDREVRALLKATYTFDTKSAAERGGKE
ncbi:MAG: hypothetical protein PHN84_06415 [Desulfuromonadaceae bacterium]|nr:hypothetical protein [Desulfuromonadaceae bacterium]MDD2854516.1 hypothetical protein [Desulfuromonadaceae bacterium]